MAKAIDNQKEPSLVCFDVDNTAIIDHMHNSLSRQGIAGRTKNVKGRGALIENGRVVDNDSLINHQYDSERVRTAANRFLDNDEVGLRNAEELQSFIVEQLESGNHVAFTSFSQYPDAVEELKKRILTEEQCSQVPVITGFPPGGQSDPGRKNFHIQQAMAITGVTNPENVVLVDDSSNNVKAAKSAGYHAVHVDKELPKPPYLRDLRQELNVMDHNVRSQSQEQVHNESVYENIPLRTQQNRTNSTPLAGTSDDTTTQKLQQSEPSREQTYNPPVYENVPLRDDRVESDLPSGAIYATVQKNKASPQLKEPPQSPQKKYTPLVPMDINIVIHDGGDIDKKRHDLVDAFRKVGLNVDCPPGERCVTLKSVSVSSDGHLRVDTASQNKDSLMTALTDAGIKPTYARNGGYVKFAPKLEDNQDLEAEIENPRPLLPPKTPESLEVGSLPAEHQQQSDVSRNDGSISPSPEKPTVFERITGFKSPGAMWTSFTNWIQGIQTVDKSQSQQLSESQGVSQPVVDGAKIIRKNLQKSGAVSLQQASSSHTHTPNVQRTRQKTDGPQVGGV